MRVLGINAVFHDPASALVVDGRIVAMGGLAADGVTDRVEVYDTVRAYRSFTLHNGREQHYATYPTEHDAACAFACW